MGNEIDAGFRSSSDSGDIILTFLSEKFSKDQINEKIASTPAFATWWKKATGRDTAFDTNFEQADWLSGVDDDVKDELAAELL